ncbi:hypothetical protein PR048_012738 [Dryococelus australis]|uniref:Uncharacterized protein n=1 Tax=Dryococelus australis TaxID=614101 RepID=A0ABQ9HQA5_9NEOP|nr:hypothetical protein PR048_012738 [Dryococelus australis]
MPKCKQLASQYTAATTIEPQLWQPDASGQQRSMPPHLPLPPSPRITWNKRMQTRVPLNLISSWNVDMDKEIY